MPLEEVAKALNSRGETSRRSLVQDMPSDGRQARSPLAKVKLMDSDSSICVTTCTNGAAIGSMPDTTPSRRRRIRAARKLAAGALLAEVHGVITSRFLTVRDVPVLRQNFNMRIMGSGSRVMLRLMSEDLPY